MNKEKYLELLSTAKGEEANIAFALYKVIDAEESKADQIKALRFLCEKSIEVESDESVSVPEYYTKDELMELRNTVGIYVDVSLQFLLQKAYIEGFPASTFYAHLWKIIFTNKVYMSPKEKGFALHWTLADRFIPYVYMKDHIEVNALSMNSFGDTHPMLMHRIRYISSFLMGKRTERAALLIQELQKADSLEEKTVMLAYALSVIEKNARNDSE